MKAITLRDLPLAIADGEVQVRLRDEGGLSVGYVRLPAGADKGRVRMHTNRGHQDFAAGEAFYWAPGHAPEALEDVEYVDFSPTEEFQRVIAHIVGGATQTASPRPAP